MQCGFRNKDRETEDLIWQARGREEAEKLSQQWADELHRRLVVTQTLICQALQGVRTCYKLKVDFVSVVSVLVFCDITEEYELVRI